MSQEDPADFENNYKNDIQIIKDQLSISTPSLFRVKTFNATKKNIYILEVHEDESITGLVHESINDPLEVRESNMI